MAKIKDFFGDDEEDLDRHIDKMIDSFERQGKPYDLCRKAMLTALQAAKEPLSLVAWAYNAQYDVQGRERYSDEVFEKDSVKKVIIELCKQKRAYRLGRQSFFAATALERMTEHVHNVLLWSCAVMDAEDIGAKILSPKAEKMKRDRGFVEEQIILMALECDIEEDTGPNARNQIIKLADTLFVHADTITVCADFVAGTMQNVANRSFTPEEITQLVQRCNYDGMDNQYQGRSIAKIREAMTEPMLRREVITKLIEDSRLDYDGGKLVLLKKEEKQKYRTLDDPWQ